MMNQTRQPTPEEPTIVALAFEPHADAFLGSPFWNAILHRKIDERGIDWRSSRVFFLVDAAFALWAKFWLRSYRRNTRARE